MTNDMLTSIASLRLAVAGVILLLIFFAIATFLFDLFSENSDADVGAVVLSIVGVLVVWLLRIPIDDEMHRRRHTMETLAELRSNTVFEQHRL